MYIYKGIYINQIDVVFKKIYMLFFLNKRKSFDVRSPYNRNDLSNARDALDCYKLILFLDGWCAVATQIH